MQLRFAFPVLLVSATFAARARAASDAQLVYSAPDECPDAAAFAEKVRARGAEVSDESDRVVEIAIKRDGDEFVGTMVLRTGVVASSVRELRGASCAEVDDALSIVTSIAIHTGEAPAAPPAPAPGGPATEVAAPHPSAADKPQLPQTGKMRFDTFAAITAFGGATVGMVPGVTMPQFDLQITRTVFAFAPDGQTYLLNPSWRVRASFFGPGTYHDREDSAAITGLRAGLGLCIAPRFSTIGLTLFACAEFGGGVAHISVTNNKYGHQVSDKAKPIGGAAFDVEAQWNFQTFHLSAKAGLSSFFAPLVADGEHGITLFEAKSLQGTFMLGLGGHFW